jgi:hypothetical protein
MANVAGTSRGTPDVRAGEGVGLATSTPEQTLPAIEPVDRDKVLPLPEWLKKVYFIFPVVLYIPDAIFNFYVYSDGASVQNANPLLQAGQLALWGFLSVGVVGMAYLLSVLAPWHWGQGHRVQAFFCGLGVVIATAITTWNSLAYRSTDFRPFPTDQWTYQMWPQLQSIHISITMVLVAIAPPFWGLFWAIVQPTETGRSLRQLQESHAERLLRLQHEAELKRIKAETNAKIREAQLRGMARTAATAREQAREIFAQGRREKGETGEQPAVTVEEVSAPAAQAEPSAAVEPAPDSNIRKLFAPATGRESGARSGAAMYNHAASATPTAHAGPAFGAAAPVSQPMLLSDLESRALASPSAADTAPAPEPRTPPTLARMYTPALAENDDAEPDGLTGTTGPRPAIRRGGQTGMLLRNMNEPGNGRVEAAMQEAMRELNPKGGKVPARELVALVAQKLKVDEAAAKAAIQRVRESRRNGRG